MTAEIAILNKTAVALAADSAVTISAGTDQQKIFDTADKLFELSNHDPVGIMINNSMNFLEAPLPVLIKDYRNSAPPFANVRAAADSFLDYLRAFIGRTSLAVKERALRDAITPLFKALAERTSNRWERRIFLDDRTGLRPEFAENPDLIGQAVTAALDEETGVLSRLLESLPDATFIGEGPLEIGAAETTILNAIVREELTGPNVDQIAAAVEIGKLSLRKAGTWGNSTGLIIAGFGSNELFPTLISYELQGCVGSWLKVVETNHVDIDRDGMKAAVIPFAQREMVERFLYGLDGTIQRQITTFCKSAVPTISEQILGVLDLPERDKEQLSAVAEAAQTVFFDGLASNGFDAIRQESRAEIEDMVEFMPKPEMARMAEALVNLTSMKRRVSRGFETVGGAVDVAVISLAEGFVWVQRKHYFPPELNGRFAERMRTTINGRAVHD